jgi:hypothetical protein
LVRSAVPDAPSIDLPRINFHVEDDEALVAAVVEKAALVADVAKNAALAADVPIEGDPAEARRLGRLFGAKD